MFTMKRLLTINPSLVTLDKGRIVRPDLRDPLVHLFGAYLLISIASGSAGQLAPKRLIRAGLVAVLFSDLPKQLCAGCA